MTSELQTSPTLQGSCRHILRARANPSTWSFPIEELLRRAHPLPDHDEMVIEDLSEEEGEAFLAAVQS